MEEYSLSFLVKDRCLDDKKIRWIQNNVKRRECVQFVNVQTAKDSLDNPHRPLADIEASEGEDRAGEDVQRRLCRCGRQYSQHEHLQQRSHYDSSRDYRLWSISLPTDVCAQLTQTELSRYQPISYCPKQVIRLAADTELDVLQELIGPIWSMPKASFLVSVHGSGEGVRDLEGLRYCLADFLRVLSNPGSVSVTVSLTGWEMYQQVLKACDITWKQLPYAEITPVAFVPWSKLHQLEKETLQIVTEHCGSSVEQESLQGQIPAVDIRKKGYFFLADYGVHADMSGDTQKDEETDQPSPFPPQSVRSERYREGMLEDISSDVSSLASSTAAAAAAGKEEAPLKNADAPQQSPNTPKLQDTDAPQQDSGAPRRQQELNNEASPARRRGSPKVLSQRLRQDSLASDPAEDLGEADSEASPSERFRLMSESDAENIYENAGEASTEPAVSETVKRRQCLGGDQKSGNRFFTYNFPHPLRGRVETLLKERTHDADGQGSVMIMFGYTSFLDLAAAHGAICSGVPVIFDQEGTGATAFLKAVLKDIDQKNEQPMVELLSHNRHYVMNDEGLQTTIGRHSSKLPDFLRYERLVSRVVRDIVHRRQLVTVHDLYSSDSLLDAAVEALIKARAREEAVVFLQKNTMALATEDEGHPVKLAQKDFQKAVVQVALKLNRPDLLDVVMQQGCVNSVQVLGNLVDNNGNNNSNNNNNNSGRSSSPHGGKSSSTDESIPYAEIKDVRCFAARGRFVERVCGLKKVAGWNREDASSVVHSFFLYAILNGRTQLAQHFWKHPLFQDHVAQGLLAAQLSRYMAENVPGDNQIAAFNLQAQKFEALAKGTLNDCYLQDPKKASELVTRQAKAFELSPIEAAISFQMRSFVAHPASSDFLEAVWKGERQDLSSSADNTKKKSCRCCFPRQKCSPFFRFMTAPRTVCFVSTVFYLLFLGLFGHNIIMQSGRGALTIPDIVLIVWTLVFAMEEILQALKPEGFLVPRGKKTSVKAKLSVYISDAWNRLDLFCLFFFVLGYILRAALPDSEAGHIILSIVYIPFFLRLLQVLTVSPHIGPMLPMIWNMLGDLLPFLVILFIFVLAYGLTSEALLHAGTSWHGLYLLYLPRVAFWPIFGEYGLDNIDGGSCGNNTLWYTEAGSEVMCPSHIGRHIVPVLLGVYIVITNVLMLNLLIAYFNHSFEKVHTESHTWWAWLRCGLIGEYYGRPLLPAPFVLLYRVAKVLCFILRKIYRALQTCYGCLCRRNVRAGGRGAWIYDSRIYGFNDISLPSRGIAQLHEIFTEEAKVLDILDLEEFRFNNLWNQTDYKKSYFAEHSAAPSSNDMGVVGKMSELKRWEAAKAVSQVPSSAAPSTQALRVKQRQNNSHQKDLEILLLRLEKKIEENKQQLEVLNNALARQAQSPETAERTTVHGSEDRDDEQRTQDATE